MIDQNSQFFAILTAVGEAKQANATALGQPWTFSHMGVGDANLSDPIPSRTQTRLINEWRRAPVNQVRTDPANPNIIIAEQVIPADVGGKWIREIALYDADGDMVAVANCAPSFKPLLVQGTGKTQIIRMNFIVANTESVVLKIDPAVVLATREYVDLQIIEALAKLDFKHSVLVATTANIVLSGIQTVDGVLLSAGSRVLVKDQAQAKDNGIYVVPVGGAWKRAQDADASVEVTPGLFVSIEKGAANGDSVWQLVTDAPIVLGTTALTFEVVAGRTGIVAGTYRSLTVDKLGRVIAGTNPTTLAGAGIADALSSTPQGVLTGAIADIAKHDVGVYSGPTTDKPTPGGLYMRWKYPGANPLAFDLYAHMASGADTFGFRRVGSDGLYIWREVYHTGNFDPTSKADKSQLGTAAALTATATTSDTTAGRALRVADFGLGGASAPGVTGGDCNSIEATGVYSIAGATLNVPLGAGSGSMLFHMNYSLAAGNRTATQEIVTRGIPARKFWRARVVDVWGGWVEGATTGVNSSITALTGLTTRPSFGGNLAWDAGNFDPSTKINKDQSQAVGFFGGAKTAPYLLHADGTFVYLQVDRPKDTALLTANGWSKNADTGEITQRAEVAIGDSVGSMQVSVTWPFQFPSKCLRADISLRVANGSPISIVAGFFDITATGATVKFEELNSAVQSGLVLMVEAKGY